MGFSENQGHDAMSDSLRLGVRELPADATHVRTTAPLGSAQVPFGSLDATPLSVSADRSIDWNAPVLDGVKAKKGDAPVTAQPAWVGDFVNHLARTNGERNPNLGIRVQLEAGSKVSSTLRGG